MAKLYLVHCGFYDQDLCEGLYESHVNFFVAANDFEDARRKAKLIREFQEKRMHVDGLQEVQAVEGYSITMTEDPALEGRTQVVSHRHRDLAPPPKTPSAT